MRRSTEIATAFAFTAATLVLGKLAFGYVTMLVFTAGFAGGFVLWLIFPSKGSWRDISTIFWITLALFFLHRVEEKQLGFFQFLSDVTGQPTPDIASVPVVLLVVLSVGAWLLIPYLMKRELPLGRYFCWTFFASMGITELAHYLVFPFMAGPSYGFVPGMISVAALAPIAWVGMRILARGRQA
ncbi:hypothetical protein ACVNIS_11370 [Sphaerotilaceae bacterium SBD11-9]